MSTLERLQAEYDRINALVKELRNRQDEIDLAMTEIIMEERDK